MYGNDDQDPNLDTPYPTTPNPFPNGPTDSGGVGQIQAWYQQYLGRPATLAEVNAHQGNPGGLAAVEALIRTSPEAQAYTQSHQPPTPPTPPTHDPTPPGPTPPNAPPPTTTTGPAYTPPPAFQYADFQDPTGQDVLNDKGYQFELGQGMDAIGRKNAALGTLNTGGTIGDFMRFGTDLAQSKYGDIWNRKLTDYSTNRAGALQTYNTNYGTQYQDPYSISQHNYDQNKAFDFNTWIEQYNQGRNNRNDAFDHRYRILGMY